MPLNYVGPSHHIQPILNNSNHLIRPSKNSGLEEFEKALKVEKSSVDKNKVNNFPPKTISLGNDNRVKTQKLTQQIIDKKNIKNSYISKNQTDVNDLVDQNGINLAVKEAAIEMEQQFLGFLWNLALNSEGQNFEGGIGEEIFSKELTNDMMKNINGDDMGELAQQIYDEALIQENKDVGENSRK